jgi:hypothetical protein
MPAMNPTPLIDKIYRLESALGGRWVHPILEPFLFNPADIIEVQTAAKKISTHLGLPPLSFIVTYNQLKKRTAASINLDNTNVVQIEIDISYMHDVDLVLAILAHEICHKYLHFNNLKCFPDYENEMLTDAATIYTGLGKLSLNGCMKAITQTTYGYESTKTATTTRRVGYMNLTQFAFVYRLVCMMRRIPEHGMISGLTESAKHEVSLVGSSHQNYFDVKYFNNDFLKHTIEFTAKNQIGQSHQTYAKFLKSIKIVKECVLTSAKEMYDDYHAYVKRSFEKIKSQAASSRSEQQNYINNLMVLHEITCFEDQLEKKCSQINKYEAALSELVTFLAESYPESISKSKKDFLFRFECPSCKKQMRIAQRKIAMVSCPNCKYSFVVDTGVDEIVVAVQGKKVKVTKDIDSRTINLRQGFWSKVKSIFR